MTPDTGGQRSFTMKDQLSFAELSSDRNPLHLDTHFARRTQFGFPVVHGIHHVLWAANRVLTANRFPVRRIKVRFSNALLVDEPAQIGIRNSTGSTLSFQVMTGSIVVASVSLFRDPAPVESINAKGIEKKPEIRTEPRETRFEELAGTFGSVAVNCAEDELRELFPALVEAIGAQPVRGLLAASQLVGMACPGLYSLFTGLDVSLDASSSDRKDLSYAVAEVDARFRSVHIAVQGLGISGRLETFSRLPPVAQPALGDISKIVHNNEFSGKRVLIIGGSRGLGEVTAKIIAAGGGHPIITYHSGQDDAERVAGEIQQFEAPCDTFQFDVFQSAQSQLAGLKAVDACYYFATPKIFLRKSSLYEADKMQTFLQCYVDGFFDLSKNLPRLKSGKIALFYPSTVAIDMHDAATTEYAMAKAAGEILCANMNQFLPDVQVISRRLPRILTDQTSTIGMTHEAAGAIDVMLPIVREMHAMTATSV
jgi:NAD(P)-dependent dehydrogenase (short-subunit alcohol dehydrogenase family)